MSDALEAGDSGVKISRTEVSNHLANGQSNISESLETSSQLGSKIGVKLGDTATPVGSEICSPNVIQGETLQAQMETRNTPPITNTTSSAPAKTNILMSTIPGHGYREDRFSPSKMQVKAPSPSSLVNASTEAVNSNLLQSGPLEENSNIPYSNGPPTNTMELNYKPTISQLNSTPSLESPAHSAAAPAPYQKTSPLSSSLATSDDSSGQKLAPILSGPHQVDSSPLHATGDQSLPSSSSPQPRPSPSQIPPVSASAQQFPPHISSQPMTTTVQSTASFTSVASNALSSVQSRPQAYPQHLGESSQFPTSSKMSQGPFQNQIPLSSQIPQYPNNQMSQQPHFPGYISQNPVSGQISQPVPGAQVMQSPTPVQSLPAGQMSQHPLPVQRPPFSAPNQIPQPPFTGQMTRFSSPNQQSSPAGPKFTNPYNPPLSQPQPLPPTSSAIPGVPGSFPSQPSSYQVPPHSSQNFPPPAMQSASQRPSAPAPFPPNNLPRQAFPSNSQQAPPGVFFPPNQQPPMPPVPSQMQAQQLPMPPLPSQTQPQQPPMPPLPNQTQPQQPLMPPLPNQTQPQQPLMPPIPNKSQPQQPPMPPIPNQAQPQQPPMPTFPNQMPPQQTPMPYIQRPPPPVTSQPSNWAQANGIPNRMPQFDAANRQQMPGNMPMYPQGSQDMPQNTQVPAMVGNVQQQMTNDPSQMSRRYPQQTGYQQYPSGTSVGNSNSVERMSSQFRNLSVTRDGFNKLWGADCYDLLQSRTILPAERVEPPKIQLHQEFLDGVNCRPEIFRCTLTKIPESNSLLQKSRLPLGILIHPFKDINNLPVVQCNTIVRCRSCRTYINPFVYFVDHRRWKCNLCFRVNDMPEEFQFDPVTKTFGDPSRRPEIRSSTIEYIAPSEYMLRPPQAAVYLFLLDVSCGAVEQGYLSTVCDVLSEELSQLPGDSRTQIGFIAFDSSLHFFALAEGLTQPQHMVISDIEEVFLPRPDNLLVNLQECKDLVQDLLAQLPTTFLNTHDTGSALGPALQAAHKLMAPTGGRVTVFQTCLPTVGPGALKVRGDSGGKEASAQQLQAATDFYKRLALDCSGHQVAVDLFILGNNYTDLATLSGVSQFSGGCIHHLPRFDGRNNFESGKLERSFHRYLSRKIGFEAVMRIRCSRGLSIHTFHGHFFVRSTDLLSLPNVNPDAGFGMQVAIDESLSDLQNVCFQAALLYTSSKGERRIRVHTLCLPIAANVNDVVCSADQQCIIGLLAKMAVDRSLQSSPADARDAFINVATDVLSTYRLTQSIGPSSGLLSPHSLRLLPLYILALLKHAAFRSGQGTRLDDRVYAMCQMKTLPLSFLMQEIYPDLYPIHDLHEQMSFKNSEGQVVPNPPRLHLSAEKLDSRGVFLLDRGDIILIYVGRLVAPQFCQDVFGVPQFATIQDDMYEIPLLSTSASELLNNFVRHLQSEKPYEAAIQVIREDSRHRMQFIEKLLEDRSESALSYYEFLQHLKAQVK